MNDPNDHEYYRVWFNRLARGIALVGPSLLLLIILATFVTRLFNEPEQGSEERAGQPGTEQTETATEAGKPPAPVAKDSSTTPSTMTEPARDDQSAR